MKRRAFLKWASRGLTATCAAIVALPGVSFILDVLRRGSSNGELTQRIARLKDLPLNKPVRVPVIGTRRDAWTEYPSEVLGQVWLVRRKADSPEASEADQVSAFTATCPHLGCLIQHEPKLNSFLCPYHRAQFGHDGQRLSSSATGRQNHAPRGMDALNCRLVKDDATQDVWVEVTFQKFEQGLTKQVARTKCEI
jgi:Rieske Fe-S protein